MLASSDVKQRSTILQQFTDLISPVLSPDAAAEGVFPLEDITEDRRLFPSLQISGISGKVLSAAKTLLKELQVNEKFLLFRYSLTFPTETSPSLISQKGTAKHSAHYGRSPYAVLEQGQQNVGAARQVGNKGAVSAMAANGQILPVAEHTSALPERLSSLIDNASVVTELTSTQSERPSFLIGNASAATEQTLSERPSVLPKYPPTLTEHSPTQPSETSSQPSETSSQPADTSTQPAETSTQPAETSSMPAGNPSPVSDHSLPVEQLPVDREAISQMVSGDSFPRYYERLVTDSNQAQEFERYVQTKFPNIAEVLSLPEGTLAPEFVRSVQAADIQQLESRLAELDEGQLKQPFVINAVLKALDVVTSDSGKSLFTPVISQIEPVLTTISSLESIVKSVITPQPENGSNETVLKMPKRVLESAHRLSSAIEMVQNHFGEIVSSVDGEDSAVSVKGLKRLGDLWGLFYENSIQQWIDGEGKPNRKGVKQELLQLNREITRSLVNQSAARDSADPGLRDFLKDLGKAVSESIQRIDGGQILAQSKETPREREQLFWVPVQVGGEWTRLGIEFRRERKGRQRGSKFGNKVNIHMELKKMGRVSVELDLDAGKQLRVSMGMSESKAVNWFKEHEEEIYNSLNDGALRSVILSISSVADHVHDERDRDSFQVTG